MRRIDEVHTLVGAGSSGRGLNAGAGLDVANLLKPPLARGQLQVRIFILTDGYFGHFQHSPPVSTA